MVVDFSRSDEPTDDVVDRVFHALAHATRRDIVRRAIEREQSVSQLAREYAVSFAAVQRHVAVLEEAGLVVKRAEGRERLVRADPTMIARARRLLAKYEELWRSRVDRLDALLAADSTDAADHPQPGPPPAPTEEG